MHSEFDLLPGHFRRIANIKFALNNSSINLLRLTIEIPSRQEQFLIDDVSFDTTSNSFFMIMKILESDLLLVELDDSLPVLRHRWKKEPTGKEFRTNLQRVLTEYQALVKTYKNLAWLADTTLLGELDEETETWLVDEWEDLLFGEGGVKIHAVILGENLFADYPMEKFKGDAEQKFEDYDVHLGVFSSVDDAYSWIKEQLMLIVK